MKILLVEHNKSISESLGDALSSHFIVENAYTRAEAVAMFAPDTYVLIILDCSLPDIEGMALYSELRARDRTTPVLALTDNHATAEKVRMLDAGADDYVTKPFQMNELLARIRVLLRRGPVSQVGNILELADLRVDVAGRTVRRGGQPISLRRKEFDLLEYLLRKKKQVVTRAMILSQVWESPAGGATNTVDVHIKNLREKVDKPFDRPLIQTVPGVGYKLDT